jgi:hypothetical protein
MRLQEDEMDKACAIYGGKKRNAYIVLVGKLEGMRSVWKVQAQMGGRY